MNELSAPLVSADIPHSYADAEVVALPSRAMAKVLERTRVLAAHDGSVLIEGETGTGKTAVGSILHTASVRRAQPFVRWGCGELADSLAASTLFGHVKGAFTTAVSARIGLLEAADGGTLVLDDIDCLSLEAQQKLLRFLDDGSFSPLGDPGRQRRADVRVVASTNKDLEKLAAGGTFLPDLFYRLRRWRVWLPPLRERPDDVAALATGILGRYQRKYAASTLAEGNWFLADGAIALLRGLPWPGNIRDLESAIDNVAAFCDGSRRPISLRSVIDVMSSSGNGPGASLLGRLNEGMDGDSRIYQALVIAGWNISLAADILGCSRTTIHQRMRKNGWHPS